MLCPAHKGNTMRALIVYASWFGHNRLIAEAIATELRQRHVDVVCAPVSKISVGDVIGFDMLVLGSHSHTGHASRNLRHLCETIPLRRLNRMTVGIFGTRDHASQPGGLEDLRECLAERGCETALLPFAVDLYGVSAIMPWSHLNPEDQQDIEAFTEELWESSVAVPFA